MNYGKKILINFALTITVTSLFGCSTAPKVTHDAPVIYLNTNIGFSEDTYAYIQPNMICNVDQSLVDNIILSGAKRNIRIEAISNSSELQKSSNILAIDITKLGKDNNNGAFSGSQNAPEIAVLAMFLNKKEIPSSITHAEHCSETIRSGQTMDRGGISTFAGVTSTDYTSGSINDVCRGLRACTRKISGNVIEWVEDNMEQGG